MAQSWFDKLVNRLVQELVNKLLKKDMCEFLWLVMVNGLVCSG